MLRLSLICLIDFYLETAEYYHYSYVSHLSFKSLFIKILNKRGSSIEPCRIYRIITDQLVCVCVCVCVCVRARARLCTFTLKASSEQNSCASSDQNSCNIRKQDQRLCVMHRVFLSSHLMLFAHQKQVKPRLNQCTSLSNFKGVIYHYLVSLSLRTRADLSVASNIHERGCKLTKKGYSN